LTGQSVIIMPIVVDKHQKRKEILAASMQVFAQKGFHRTRMEEVAAAAHIGKGTIYEYFRSKTDLFLSLHDHMLAELKEFYSQELQGIEDPPEVLVRFIKAAFETFREWEPFFIVFCDFWAEGGRGEHQTLLQSQLRDAYRQSRTDLALVIEAGIAQRVFRCEDPLLAAEFILACLDGLVLHWLCDRQVFDLDHMCETLTRTILGSLEP